MYKTNYGNKRKSFHENFSLRLKNNISFLMVNEKGIKLNFKTMDTHLCFYYLFIIKYKRNIQLTE